MPLPALRACSRVDGTALLGLVTSPLSLPPLPHLACLPVLSAHRTHAALTPDAPDPNTRTTNTGDMRRSEEARLLCKNAACRRPLRIPLPALYLLRACLCPHAYASSPPLSSASGEGRADNSAFAISYTSWLPYACRDKTRTTQQLRATRCDAPGDWRALTRCYRLWRGPHSLCSAACGYNVWLLAYLPLCSDLSLLIFACAKRKARV